MDKTFAPHRQITILLYAFFEDSGGIAVLIYDDCKLDTKVNCFQEIARTQTLFFSLCMQLNLIFFLSSNYMLLMPKLPAQTRPSAYF